MIEPGDSWEGKEGRVVAILAKELPADFWKVSRQDSAYIVTIKDSKGSALYYGETQFHPVQGGFYSQDARTHGTNMYVLAVYEKFLTPRKNEYGEVAP